MTALYGIAIPGGESAATGILFPKILSYRGLDIAFSRFHILVFVV